MAGPVLIQQAAAPAQFVEWKGTDGVPQVSLATEPTVLQPKASAVTSTLVTVDTLQTLAAANADRVKILLQNVSTVAVYVKLGSGASSSDYSFVLQAGTAAADGKGGSYADENYTGIITAIAASGTGNKVAVVEF